MYNVVQIVPDFNYACGVSKHVYLTCKALRQEKNIKVYFITNGGTALSQMEELEIHPHIIDFTRGSRNPFSFISFTKQLIRFCKTNNINIIHTHHRYPEFAALIVSLFLKIKTVTTVHSLHKDFKLLSFKSDQIIAVSKIVMENIIKNYSLSGNNIQVIYNYVKTPLELSSDQIDIFYNRYKISRNDFLIIFLGRMTYEKGVDSLIAAFDILTYQQTINAKLFLIGNNDPEWKTNLVSKNPNIFIIDEINDPTIFYKVASLIVAPSRIDSFPYVMLESGIAQKPFIGGKTGGIQEFIEDGCDGFLIEPGNINELAEKVLYIYNHPEHASRVAQKLYAKVTTLSTEESYRNNLLGVYYKVIHVN